nr:hypothetical protein HmN_000451600 [Hymenolepis microstoma]
MIGVSSVVVSNLKVFAVEDDCGQESVMKQTVAADVMSFCGHRRSEHVSKVNSAFSYESSTSGAYFEGESYGPEGR